MNDTVNKRLPLRYVLGIVLTVLTVAVTLLPMELFDYVGIVYFFAPFVGIAAASFCFLPENRRGLWIGWICVIFGNFFLQHYRPDMFLQLLLDPPDPLFEPGLMYILYGAGAFLCLMLALCTISSCMDADRPIAPRRQITKILICAGWVVFAVSVLIPDFCITAYRFFPDVGALHLVLSVLLPWAQYALIHWLALTSIAWIASAIRSRMPAKGQE